MSGSPAVPEFSPPSKRPAISARLLDLESAAVYLGRTEGAVRELIWKGKLPKVQVDRRVQVDIRDLDKLIDESKHREAD